MLDQKVGVAEETFESAEMAFCTNTAFAEERAEYWVSKERPP